MKLNRALIVACLAGSFALAGSLFAADPAPAPAPEAKKHIGMEEARAIAIEKVPGGEVASEELSRAAGKLIYIFELRLAGKKGVEVVIVDAIDGVVLQVTHKTEWAARRDAQIRRRGAARN
jgi:hypothetical protein